MGHFVGRGNRHYYVADDGKIYTTMKMELEVDPDTFEPMIDYVQKVEDVPEPAFKAPTNIFVIDDFDGKRDELNKFTTEELRQIYGEPLRGNVGKDRLIKIILEANKWPLPQPLL